MEMQTLCNYIFLAPFNSFSLSCPKGRGGTCIIPLFKLLKTIQNLSSNPIFHGKNPSDPADNLITESAETPHYTFAVQKL